MSDRLQEDAVRRLRGAFSSPDDANTAFAPGRINLIGAHVDYNQGPVMPVPLGRGTAVALQRRADSRFRMVSDHSENGPGDPRPGAVIEGELSAPTAPPGWGAYPVAMSRAFKEAGHEVRGFDLAVCGDLPIGAGLSSSASLLVAVGRALDAAFSVGLSREAIARLAHRAETGFVGVSCGIMDPMASSLGQAGHALFLDCRDGSHQLVPYDRGRLRLVVIDSGTRRTLATSHFNERVAECRAAVEAIRKVHPGVTSLRDAADTGVDLASIELPGNVRDRADHIIAEIHRVFAFRQALATGDFNRCGALVTECHRSLRDLYQASTPELDFLVRSATEVDGVFGARLTGAGWGGCVLALISPGSEDRLEEAVGGAYQERFGREADCYRVG